MKFGEVGPALKAAGWDVIPIKAKTKRPVEDAWQLGFPLERVQAFAANGYAGGNTGLLAKNYPGVDIDVSDKAVARALVDLAIAKLGPAPVRVGSAPKCLLMYSTSKPFGKMKVYLNGPDGPKGPDGKDYAVEILGDGQQYIIYGEHPDGFQYRWPRGGDPATCDVWDLTAIDRDGVQAFLAAIPAALPAGWSVRAETASNAGTGDAFANYKGPLDGWGLERVVAEVLPHLDPDCGYEDWLAVGLALHHQGEGEPQWLDAWDSWSSASGKYAEGLCERKWESFTANRAAGSLTLAAMLGKTKEAREAAGIVAKADASATHRAAVLAAADEAGVRTVAQRIALDSGIDDLARETLVGVIQGKLREITGVRVSVTVIRGMVALRRNDVAVHVDAPDWARPWCYITGYAKFFNRETKELITRDAFDASNSRWLPPDDNGNFPQASRVACDVWQIPTVYEAMYLPSAGDIFTIDGREYVNLYRPETVPTGVADLAAFKVLQRHVDLLVPNGEYRNKLLQWMAWVVRNPGRKVLWAVLFKGVEGDGKSILGYMLGQAMGFANVGVISPDTLAGSTFNDWAVGRCVNVIEELKLQGHNRHDVYNKIKPLITNERIEIHGKGKAATTAVNTTNYLAFSNHSDAIPLDEHDRRQFVLFTPWNTIEELHQAIAAFGVSVEAYWDELWDVVKNRPDVVRGFFDAVDLSSFDPHSRAPATTFKEKVVAAGDLDDAEAIAKALIEQGAVGVSKSVVSSACLTNALAAMTPQVTLHTSRVRKLLEGLGFESVKGLVWWKGAPHRVWLPTLTSSLTSVDASQIKALLDSTSNSAVEDFLR